MSNDVPPAPMRDIAMTGLMRGVDSARVSSNAATTTVRVDQGAVLHAHAVLSAFGFTWAQTEDDRHVWLTVPADQMRP